MMICRADFEELFPELFPAEPAPEVSQVAMPDSASISARPDDNAGKRRPSPWQGRVVSDREPHHDPDNLGNASEGAAAAVMPAAMAYAAAWTMLSALGSMSADRRMAF
ncbi:hypothetical protein [Meridianimarinicoccus sp. MJW13]|nr:hypothetical protein [Fluviibacterium sp. MJW13]